MSLAPRDLVRPILGPPLRLMRELPPSLSLIRSGAGGAGGPSAVFLPSRGRDDGASHLRIHAIAAALRDLGWRGVVLPWRLTLAQRQRLIARADPDVIVMQTARHALNRPALYPGRRIVLDIDDADFHLPQIADAVEADWPRFAAVIAGSSYIARHARARGAGEARVVWTGGPVSAAPRPPHHARGPVLAWAQTRPMTYTREAAFVREVTARLAALRPGVTLRLYDRRPGDDPGFAESFSAPGLRVEWAEKARFSDYVASFDDVALALAPLSEETPFSRGKSFGKVLTCLDRHVPVIASASTEHARFFTPETGVITNDPAHAAEAASALLAVPGRREAMARAAFDAFAARLTTTAAAARVDAILGRVVGQGATMTPVGDHRGRIRAGRL